MEKVRTGLCVSDIAFRETSKVEVQTLVDVSDVLLEMLPDLRELDVSDDTAINVGNDIPFHRWYQPSRY